MASKQAHKRLQKEYASLAMSPPPYCFARPNESNLLECHFIIRGPEDSPYAGGEYHGVLHFPPQYPFAPPVGRLRVVDRSMQCPQPTWQGIKMCTPSGRFQPDAKICTSMSDFHPGSWNPAWSIETILTGLLSFMLSDEITTGSIRSSDEDKRRFAAASHAFNLRDSKFKAIFSDYAEATLRSLPNMGEKERGPASSSAPPTSAKPHPAREILNDIGHRPGQGGSVRTFALVVGVAVVGGITARLLRIA